MNASARFAQLVQEWTGIDLTRGGRLAALQVSLADHAQRLGFPTPDAFIDGLRSPHDQAFGQVIETFLVNHTWFFREHETLRAGLELAAERHNHRSLHVWSAGCATGEEVYSAAATLKNMGHAGHIVGSDLSSHAIEHARRGEYSDWSARSVPSWARPWISATPVTAAPSLREMAEFRVHNLVETPLTPNNAEQWDVILCRNVLIYFDDRNTVGVVDRLMETLAPGGALVLGATDARTYVPPTGDLVQRGETVLLVKRDQTRATPRPALLSSPIVEIPPPEPPPSEPTHGPPANSQAPAPTAADMQRASQELAAGNTLSALTILARVLAEDPLNVEARLYRGIGCYMSGDHTRAVSELRGALFLEPRLWPAAYYLALSYETLGRSEQAQREFERIVSLRDAPLPFRPAGELLPDLDGWKSQVVAMARKTREKRQ